MNEYEIHTQIFNKFQASSFFQFISSQNQIKMNEYEITHTKFLISL